MLITINLLPWRITQQGARKKKFIRLFISSVLSAVLISAGLYSLIHTKKQQQLLARQQWQAAIQSLNPQLTRIKAIQQYQTQLLDDLKMFATWQNQQEDLIEALEDIVRIVPQGIYLTELKRQNQRLMIKGMADSTHSITTLLQNSNNKDSFTKAKLIEIQQPTPSQTATTFSIELNLK